MLFFLAVLLNGVIFGLIYNQYKEYCKGVRNILPSFIAKLFIIHFKEFTSEKLLTNTLLTNLDYVWQIQYIYFNNVTSESRIHIFCSFRRKSCKYVCIKETSGDKFIKVNMSLISISTDKYNIFFLKNVLSYFVMVLDDFFYFLIMETHIYLTHRLSYSHQDIINEKCFSFIKSSISILVSRCL